jgi:hypothetical protein
MIVLLPIRFSTVDDPIDNDPIAVVDFEQHPIIRNSQPVFGRMIGEAFDVTGKTVL